MDVRDQEAYAALQQKLVTLWSSIDHLSDAEQTIVVVPSAEIDVELTPSVLQAYEERYLFLLLLLRQPQARMVYVTGQEISSEIVDYYLDLLPGVISSHARKRLFLVSPMEATTRSLAKKVLDRPHLVERLRSLIIDPDRAHLVPFMSTWADRELAMRLEIPMYGADPRDAHYGTKSEGRRLFARAGISHPAGREGLRTVNDIAHAIAEMRAENPKLTRVVVKSNEGVSGYGNTTVDLRALPDVADLGEVQAISSRLGSIEVDPAAGTVDDYYGTIEKEGGVVEELIEAPEVRSPSVQLRITPLGHVEVLSTHDQVLGGASGQVFMGSRFPADAGYAAGISADARSVGEELAALGVIGRFAIDFVVARDESGSWSHHAIELNLRKGGTTHPFLTLQFLTDGTYDEITGQFTAPDGRHKYYVASDHVDCDGFRGFTPSELLDVALLRGLHFDQARQVGSVFHMLSAMPAHGRLGMTSVGDSPDDADERFRHASEVLKAEATGRYTA